jgi:hypothetical protein
VSLRAPLLLAAGPLVLAVLFGFVRDIPADSECGEVGPTQAEIDAYLDGAIALFALVWAVPAVLYLLALRREHTTGSVPLVAGIFGAVAGVAAADVTENGVIGAPAGIAAALLLAAALHRVAQRPLTVRAAGLSVGVGIVMVPLGLLMAVYSVFAPGLALPALILAGVLAALATRRARHLAAGTAVHVSLFVPLIVLIIASRGHGTFC